MTVEIPVETLKLWIEDMEYISEGLYADCLHSDKSDAQDRITSMIDEIEAAMPADKEE
ncbi:MAG: hypothetical protein LBQ12_00855 [Deltaproteobacteria bacterium]|jgi:hypothetical protein|nr:hypothetical protein [Deltaproteobacteria bacterium]